jgi:hypothetical protein
MGRFAEEVKPLGKKTSINKFTQPKLSNTYQSSKGEEAERDKRLVEWSARRPTHVTLRIVPSNQFSPPSTCVLTLSQYMYTPNPSLEKSS